MTSELIEISKESKCPYRRMYGEMILSGSVGAFHKPEILFKNCRNCTGFGFYKDAEKERSMECPMYNLVLEARKFAKAQTSVAAASAAGAS